MLSGGDLTAASQADEGSVSRQTGLLASLMNLSAFVTSIPWGLACDRLGRKPVLVVGNLSCALSMFLLGFSPSYGFAAFTRVFGGLLNGVLGAVKTGALAHSQHSTVERFLRFPLLLGDGHQCARAAASPQSSPTSATTRTSRSPSAASPSRGVRATLA